MQFELPEKKTIYSGLDVCASLRLLFVRQRNRYIPGKQMYNRYAFRLGFPRAELRKKKTENRVVRPAYL